MPDLKVGARRDNENKKFRTCAGLMSDNITLKFIPLREVKEEEWWLLKKTLEIIENYAALGGRTAQGNGVIEIDKNAEEEKNLFKQQWRTTHIKENLAEPGQCVNKTQAVPDLNQFFSMILQIEFNKAISGVISQNVFWTKRAWNESKKDWNDAWGNNSVLPIAFHIRDIIRRCNENRDIRHLIFGKPGHGSRVFVSHGYKVKDDAVEVKVFGFGVNGDMTSNIRDKISNKEELEKKLFRENMHGLSMGFYGIVRPSFSWYNKLTR